MTTNIDAHLDVGWKITKYGAIDLTIASGRAVDLPAMQQGNVGGGVFVLYLSSGVQDELGPNESISEILHQASEIRKFQEQSGLKNIFLGIEGGRLLNRDINNLTRLLALDIKYLTLVHNKNIDWVDSATDIPYVMGITNFGRKVVKTCEELGILVDISHMSELSSLSVLYYSNKPVIASHSGCKDLWCHARNISDRLMRHVKNSGGIIGIPFVKTFLGGYSVAQHIDYAVQRIGINHVGIGSDLDGADCVVESAREWEHWKEPLSKMGYTDNAIAKISGENWLRVFNA